MIVALRGTLEALGPGWAVVGIGGVSVRVFLPTPDLEALGPPGSPVHLHTHLLVREDGPALYGFTSPEALRLFELLLGVSGVGPRHALHLLSAMGAGALAGAIASGDQEALTRVPGVGRKVAARIVLELKGKVGQEWGPVPGAEAPGDREVIAALTALGYSLAEARRAVAALPSTPGQPLEERVRLALQRLGGG